MSWTEGEKPGWRGMTGSFDRFEARDPTASRRPNRAEKPPGWWARSTRRSRLAASEASGARRRRAGLNGPTDRGVLRSRDGSCPHRSAAPAGGAAAAAHLERRALRRVRLRLSARLVPLRRLPGPFESED